MKADPTPIRKMYAKRKSDYESALAIAPDQEIRRRCTDSIAVLDALEELAALQESR